MNIRIIKQSIRSSECKDNFQLLIDETKKPWTEFFKRASTESIQYFAKVSKNKNFEIFFFFNLSKNFKNF